MFGNTLPVAALLSLFMQRTVNYAFDFTSKGAHMGGYYFLGKFL